MPPPIREAHASESPAIQRLARAAFGSPGGEEIATLIDQLLHDPTATPRLSLVATDDDAIVGHVLFTRAHVDAAPQAVAASILAPLAVHPDHQRRGIGGRLIAEGLGRLRDRGVDLVFVLGHPTYYARHGFTPAGARGYEAPYPIKPEHADAWMVQHLQPGPTANARGRVRCARSLDDPMYWRED